MKFNESNDDSSIILMKQEKQSRYSPHQGSAERKRRLRQIAAGVLQGDYISLSARLHSVGLSSLEDISFIKELK